MFLLFVITFFLVLVFGIEMYFMQLENIPFMTKLFLFVLLNLNIIALVTLIFFISKSFIKIYLERKHRILGYKFKTKFVVILVILTLIPSAFLFIVSSGIVTKYFDRLFDPQIKQPLNQSIEIAIAAYDMQRQQALMYAEAIVAGKTVPENLRVTYMKNLSEDASETIKAGFEGKSDTEVITGDEGDIIRAVVPKYSGGRQRGVIIVESFVSKSISENAEAIRQAYQNYMALESWKTPIKINYLLVLSFITLLIVFTALWAALRISRGIIDPIQMLVQSTEEVANGNLDVTIDIDRDDEIGQLVNSFNNMIKGLKEGHRSQYVIEKIIENINSGVISLDPSSNILIINSAACKILDVAPETVVNKNYSELVSRLGSEELARAVKTINIRDFKRLEKEFNVTIGERQVLLQVFITSLRDAKSFLGTLVVFDDLTEVVRAQKALVWQEVARRIAHEIKNPLTPIKLSTEHMIKKWRNRDDDFEEGFDRSTKTIIKEVESLKRLVDEFSRFGKMPEIHKTTLLLSSIIDVVVNLYKDYDNLDIQVSVQDNEPAVGIDPEQFKRVIINIVENAIQAMQSKGKIDIAIRHDISSNRMYIAIADNGPGIKNEDKDKLFLPYFSTRKDGTGLGLAIASRVLTEHAGIIKVKDNKPTGTVFTIELPIKEE
jgi:two-component system nitrogen regulation sensor histidine kinase NtrY